MASLIQLKEIYDDGIGGRGNLFPKVIGAVMVAINNIRLEPGTTPNHNNRKIWAKQASVDPNEKAEELFAAALALNAGASKRAIVNANDAAVQTAINTVIDVVADGS